MVILISIAFGSLTKRGFAGRICKAMERYKCRSSTGCTNSKFGCLMSQFVSYYEIAMSSYKYFSCYYSVCVFINCLITFNVFFILFFNFFIGNSEFLIFSLFILSIRWESTCLAMTFSASG